MKPHILNRGGRWVLLTMSLGIGIIFATLGTGPLPVAAIDVMANVMGTAPQYDFAVRDTGLPRATLALIVGAAFGAAGSLVQSLTRNPLGSPDIIGFDAGAATGALVAITVFGIGAPGVSWAAAVGGLTTALVVFLLAGGVGDGGYRLILVGIGIGASLAGVNSYLLTRSAPQESLVGARWLVGSLNTATWDDVTLGAVAIALLLPAAAYLGRHLRIMELGNSTAIGLGVPISAARTAVITVAVLLAAAPVSLTGPIAFVALAAPHITSSAVRRPGPLVIGSASTGALLLVASDFLAQRAFGDHTVPVGIVTGVLGGCYLAWLLTHEWRR